MDRQIIVTTPEELCRMIDRAVESGVRQALETMKRAPKAVMDERETAEYLGLSPCTLRQWRVNKRGPEYSKAGGGVRYRREELDKWLAANNVLTTESREFRRSSYARTGR